MSVRPSLSHDKVVRAALDFVDEFGMEALSTRSLGQVLGAHHTALYRHFKNKAELVKALFDLIIADVTEALVDAPSDPKSRIRAIAINLRIALHKHPALVATMVNSTGTENSFELQKLIINAFRELGVPEKDLAARYQTIESYVFGATMFDYTGAPDHLKTRMNRYRSTGIVNLQVLADSEASIDEANERAFIVGLDLLLAT